MKKSLFILSFLFLFGSAAKSEPVKTGLLSNVRQHIGSKEHQAGD